MDIATLKSLGISVEQLGDRIVDQAVEVLLSGKGFDPDTEEETRYETRFKRDIEARIQKAVDQKIAALAEQHLIPKVGEMIEAANLQQTNNYGEKKGAPQTFIEYIAARAQVYMSEEVDITGKSKSEGDRFDSYNWRSVGPRLTVLMRLHIKETLEQYAKQAVNDVNKELAKGIQKAASDAIAAAANAVKVQIAA